MDDRRLRQVQIAAAVTTALVVVVAVALVFVHNKDKPTSLTAGTTTTSEGATSTTETTVAETTTVQPAVTTTVPPTTVAAGAGTTVAGTGACPATAEPPLLFVHHGEHGPPWHIWRYDLTSCKAAQVTRDNGDANVLNWGESWSPKRERIAFVRKDTGLIVMNANGTNERVLLKEGAPTTQSSGAWTSWSPDGKRIAFAGRSDGLWLADSSTGKATNLVNDGNCRSASWSPDGTRIAFDLGGKIMSIRADGTNRTDIGPGTDADWGPDGRIAFSPPPGGGVSVMNADGTGVKRIVNESTTGAPSWSPEGKQIAYWSVPEGVVIIDADGSGKRVLVPDGDHNWQPAW